MMDLRKLFAKKTNPVEQTVQGVSDAVSSISDQVSDFSPLASINNMSVSERQDASKILEKVITYISFGLIALSLVTTIPLLGDWFDLPKQTIVLLGSLVAVFLWALKSIVSKKIAINKNPLFLPVIAFVAVSLVSSALATNKVTSLLSDPMIYLGAALLFFLLSTTIEKINTLYLGIKVTLITVAIIAGWSVVETAYSLVATSMKLATTVVFLSPNFSLAGSTLSQLVLILLALPMAVGFYLVSKERGTKKDLALTMVLLVVLVLGLATTAYSIYLSRPVLMPQDAGWRVATATLGDSVRAAFLGTGPKNYIDAYSLFKPASINNTNLWNLRFATASNFYFYVLTTMGIAGTAVLILLLVKLGRLIRSRMQNRSANPLEKSFLVTITLALVIVAFIPASLPTFYLLFATFGLLMAYYKISEVDSVVQPLGSLSHEGEIRLGILVAAGVALVAAAYFSGRLILGDYYFGQSLVAASQNKGTDTYNLQIQAINLNPWNDSYHLSYAQTNLALANSIAGLPNITDQQKQTVVQLVQQSIREGRVAVTLEPQHVGNWENLSLIYRNLINFAQGADQWAILTQNQAIALEPTNPRLQLDLGGIYYALGNYQVAAQAFAQAANLKPDFANAHYNLAQALKQLKLNDQALSQLQLTASLVCAQGNQAPDCQRVNQEITNLGSTPANPGATTTPTEQPTIAPATPSAEKNLPKAKTVPPAVIASPSGEVTQ